VAEGTLGLRDYGAWLSEELPGRVGGSDIDCVVEQSRTGRVLFLEFKPLGKPLPMGQRLLLKTMARKDIDVWVVWEYPDGQHMDVGVLTKDGEVLFREPVTKKQLGRRVLKWWNLGLED
jgi:hypothetical protein